MNDNVLFPKRCYFTLADYATQGPVIKNPDQIAGELELNLKAIVLLQEEVVFRLTSIVNSPITSKVIYAAKELIEAGVLRPEVRIEGEDLGKGSKKHLLEEILEMSGKNRLEIFGKNLADKRSFQLVDQIYKIKFLQENNNEFPRLLKNWVTWEDVENVFSLLFPEKVVDRKDFLPAVKNLFGKDKMGRDYGDILVQTIYYGMGSLETRSNPLWLPKFDPILNHDIWTLPFPSWELIKQNQKAFKLADKKKYSILQRRFDNGALFPVIKDTQAEDLVQTIGIPITQLKEFSWNEIRQLRNHQSGTNLRDYLSRQSVTGVNQDNLTEKFVQLLGEQYVSEQEHYDFPLSNGKMLIQNPKFPLLSFSKLVKGAWMNKMKKKPIFSGMNKTKVFISYSHKDKDIASCLKESLQKEKDFEILIDEDNLYAGDDLSGFIEKSIHDSDITLLIVSRNSLLSTWVGMETVNTINYEKFKKHKKLVPCYVDDDFLTNREFGLEAKREIDQRIEEIEISIQKYMEENMDTLHLNSEKTRYYRLKNNLSEILYRLNESLCIDIRGKKLQENMPKIIISIKKR